MPKCVTTGPNSYNKNERIGIVVFEKKTIKAKHV